MKMIGVSGYARAGKDEIATAMTMKFGFRRMAFADPLRKMLLAINPLMADGRRLHDVIDEFTWERYKESEYGEEIRRLLQRMGTEAGRKVLGEDVWVNACFRTINQDSQVIITDLRFPNEARAILAYGGVIWRVTRPGVGPVNNHFSETALDKWEFDEYINNDGTRDDLYAQVKRIYSEKYGIMK